MAGGIIQSAIEQLFKILFMPELKRIAKEIDNDREFQKSKVQLQKNLEEFNRLVTRICKEYPWQEICKDPRYSSKLKNNNDLEDVSAPCNKG